MTVSIIVPIYHGKKYIENLICQAEQCQEKVKEGIHIELVLSNDDPKEELEKYASENVGIVVLNTDVNRGIQGARVQGLKECNGDYLVFLDQDDIIYPDYVSSQVQAIGDADAVVCRYISEKRLRYNASEPFEKLITREYMLEKGDPIVSTGAVLLRRTSIPDEWINNILTISGADDYFLWLCMLAKNKKFVLNQEVLFEHVMNGFNTSLDSLRMFDSENEMFEVLLRLNLFEQEEMNLLKNAIYQKRIRLLDKFRQMFFTLNGLMEIQENRNRYEKIFERYKKLKVAIYGAGYVGKRLHGVLKQLGINVECFADQNADFLDMSLTVYKLEEIPDCVDFVIVTLVQHPERIVKGLQDRYSNKKVVAVMDWLNEINNEE